MPIRILKQKQIQQILKLQQLFHSRYLTAQLLNQLISCYVEIIECFDQQQSPMRKYFLNKIQFILSRPQINSMLQRTNNPQPVMDKIRQTVRITNGNNTMDQTTIHKILMQVLQEENRKNKQNQMKENSSKEKYPSNNISGSKQKLSSVDKIQESKEIDRSNKIQHQMKIMRQIQKNMKTIQNQYNIQEQKNSKKQTRINKLMQQQNSTIQNRLAMRKKKKQVKKSVDEKQIKQMQEIQPVIKKQQFKQEIKQAQKQIQEAVVRMTTRMTKRQTQNQRGVTGLLNTGQRKGTFNQQKGKGRITMNKKIQEEDQQDLNFIQLKKPQKGKK